MKLALLQQPELRDVDAKLERSQVVHTEELYNDLGRFQARFVIQGPFHSSDIEQACTLKDLEKVWTDMDTPIQESI